MRLNKILYGGDYNPEQWFDKPEVLEQDINLIKKAGVNVVTLGVFSWAMLEPEEGNYCLDWLEEIIERLYNKGVMTILATPSGARPKWLADKYPEVLRVRDDRRRNLFGGRHNHCYTSPVYLDKVKSIDEKLAERFAGHPAVIMWHISNEFGGECHCPLCQKAFQEWLKKRYGSIEELNQKWYTTFWSHTYQSFDQIESPSSIGEAEVHALTLDWRRFVTGQTVEFMKNEIQALRHKGAKQPVTTNMMYDFKGLNYGRLVPYIDVVSWDSYPQWHKKEDQVIALDTAMQHDYMRSLKHQPFLLMESSPTSTNWQGVSKLKKPGLLEAASLQAIAHGSDSVQYFQIRQSRGGSEKFHGSLIDHTGRDDTRVFKEAAQIGRDLSELHELANSRVKAPAAVIYDVENRWALEDAQGPRGDGLYYHEAVMKSYQALKKFGLDVDVIDMDQELETYQVAAVPMLYMLRGGIEDKIRKFVRAGGTLFLTYWSGIVDSNDLCFLGETPSKLIDVIGLKSDEIDGLYDGELNGALPVEGNNLELQKVYTCRHLCDLVTVETAAPLMVYESNFYAGKPVVTCNEFGKGRAYYIAADMETEFYTDFYNAALRQAGMKGLLPQVPDGILLTSRESDEHKYIFAQNFGREKAYISVPDGGEVIFGNMEGRIERYETVIIKMKKQLS